MRTVLICAFLAKIFRTELNIHIVDVFLAVSRPDYFKILRQFLHLPKLNTFSCPSEPPSLLSHIQIHSNAVHVH